MEDAASKPIPKEEGVGDLTAEIVHDLEAAEMRRIHAGTDTDSNSNDHKNNSQLIYQNLTDQQMNAVARNAEQKLSIALLASNKMIHTSLNKANKKVVTHIEKAHFLDSLVANIRRLHDDKAEVRIEQLIFIMITSTHKR